VHIRLGEVLIESGVLSPEQVEKVLSRQRETGEPFGVISEQLCGVEPAAIEEAWATQYARITRRIDPAIEVFDAKAADLVTRRQAWQFRVLPIRFDDGELMMATTRRHLRRALRFATNVVGLPVYLVLAEPLPLGEALCRRYPLPGMTPDCIEDDALERLLHI
jgi:hypothetical protein